MREIDRLVPMISPLNANAADHLQRSGESVMFNTAEALAAWKPKVKLNSFDIGRREANEVRAVLRRVVIQGIIPEHETRRAYNLAGAIIGMIVSAAKAVEEGKGRTPPED